MKACKEATEIMGPYLYGEATQQEAGNLERHLESCESCRKDLGLRRQSIAILSPERPTSSERERIISMVNRGIAAETAQARNRRTGYLFKLAGAFVLACGLFGAGVWVGKIFETTRPTTTVVSRATAPVRERAMPLPAVKAEPKESKPLLNNKVLASQNNPPRRRMQRREQVEVVVVHHVREIAPMPLGLDDARLAMQE